MVIRRDEDPCARRRSAACRAGIVALACVVGCAGDDAGESESDGVSATSETAGTTAGTSGGGETTTTTGGGATSSTTGETTTTGDTTTTTGEEATTGDATTTTTGGVACEPTEPLDLVPCGPGSCWSTLTFSAYCGDTVVDEDFSSGNYNVHEFALALRAGVPLTLTLARTGGDFDPALILRDAEGATVFDGEAGFCDEDSLVIVSEATGVDGDAAIVELTAATDMDLTAFASAWHVVDGDFAPAMPTDATYTFTVSHGCAPEVGASDPPNFDENDVEGGYYVLPDADPPGLYTHKHDDCSRGTRRAIQVLTTVAARFAALRPEFAPIDVLDLNEAWCSNVDHATHDDGTHADLIADCATNTSCGNWIPAVDLARLFVDTGEVCGILFNDAKVQAAVNPYFEATQGYGPWKQAFMRSVTGHEVHFHIRVKKPDGTCN
ncbi:MAG: hypothetical protein KC486_17470 [Myxococcales bacterium]|nr:hypothetical protein [Myxococcales bacterium]